MQETKITAINATRKRAESQTTDTKRYRVIPGDFMPRELRVAIRSSFLRRDESIERVSSKLRVPRLAAQKEIRRAYWELWNHVYGGDGKAA